MSYLDDPRVFLATERTLLAWIRTEIAILAFAFIIKKFGVEEQLVGQNINTTVDVALYILCITTVLVSLLSFVQAYITLSKLSEKEIPGPLAKPLVLFAGLISIILSIGMSTVIYII